MSAAHTPGPWAVREHWATEYAFEVYPTHGGDEPKIGQWSAIVEVGDGTYEDEAEANAHLIAAAPDLQASLQRLLDQCDRLRLPEWKESPAERDARALLARIGGAA